MRAINELTQIIAEPMAGARKTLFAEWLNKWAGQLVATYTLPVGASPEAMQEGARTVIRQLLYGMMNDSGLAQVASVMTLEGVKVTVCSRTQAELDGWVARDPVACFARALERAGVLPGERVAVTNSGVLRSELLRNNLGAG